MAQVIDIDDSTADFSEGTLTNIVAVNPALSFDGVDDYVDCGADASLDITSEITIEAWINIFTFPDSTQIIVEKGYDGSNEGYYLRFIYVTEIVKLQIGSYDGEDHNVEWTITGLNTGEYHHVAGVYDGSYWRLYFDGLEVASASNTIGALLSNAPFSIGGAYINGTWSRFLNGAIDEVRVWNIARTQTEIQDDMNKELTGTEIGLVGYWKFNEGSGTIVYDSTANNNDGTINGAAWIANTEHLELWQPDYYGAFDDNLNLLKKDGTILSPESGAVVTLRANEGKFGGAVAVEEGTTNLNDYDINWVGWASSNSNMTTLISKTGKHSFTVKGTSNVAGAYVYIYPCFTTSNTHHSLSCKVKNNNSKDLYTKVMMRDDSNGDYISDNKQYTIKTSETKYLSVSTNTAVSSSEITFAISVYSSETDGSVDAEIFEVQGEAKSFTTSFVDGTRADGQLDYQTDLNLLQSGFIHFVVNTEKAITDHNSYYHGALIDICHESVRQLDMWMDSGISFIVNNSLRKTIVYTKNINYTVDITWLNGGNPKFYLNGNLEYDGTETDIFTDIGNGLIQLSKFNNSYINSLLFDEFMYGNFCPTAEEIQAWYNQTLPLQRSATGYRISPILDLTPVGTLSSSNISWTENLNNQTVTIETHISIDGGSSWTTWKTCTNGGSIPDLPYGTDASTASLECRQTLSTNDTTVTPQLISLTIQLDGEFGTFFMSPF